MSLDAGALVSDVGEDGVVALLRKTFDPPEGVVGIGDDAAVFPSVGDRLVLTTDTLVEGADFDLAYMAAADLGWKAMAVNVSDIAAMGAEPVYAFVTLCLPAQTPLGFVMDLIEGLHEAATTWQIAVLGGDLSGAPAISLGISLLGHVDRPLLRQGAKLGDGIFVTGGLGGSSAGLYLLRRDARAEGPLVQRHRRPVARLDASRILRGLGVTSMIDVSDGLVIDLARLMKASGWGCDVDPDRVPLDPHLRDIDGIDPLRAALFGGEDFELLFTAAAGDLDPLEELAPQLGAPVTRIGSVTSGECMLGPRSLNELEEDGWDHLRSR